MNLEIDIQVICGCFKGGLDDFEKKVKEVHKNNEHGIAYMNFINKIKNYIKEESPKSK